ncbi:hypothetical protein LOZ61_005773 [Ophidiomyces ophidiicola]|uniref:Uncharacterized protein n=1 Tax=Ophidiomyces ophidiicola TaxID=1387563 RepID=A0ACB8URW9_9EURO|nr:uncharacterized protein LOZ57_000410 [Ophidiomyces ophidiicola]KAI1908097.1 hypothetical protein LOZ61_005773 [Ophidiomyces ophidiicola]KAI1923467.1 hypothetical protein LOZ60_005195 [Ophidiomyces ophidiicola]KAI1954064.1 hypothetical protein LOZ57_000410 [Ophidiomyces ophidiicola]KAI2046714.1 hypothetical protein LOZ43_005807 [Ophidiomyces ophidiicola]KAI2136079.1 hypothetical protein LOZ27_006269 [Ophidiomyces ophidiicola]
MYFAETNATFAAVESAAKLAPRGLSFGATVGWILALGFLGMGIEGYIPPAPKEPGTSVRIGLGTIREEGSAGGNLPGVAAWDVYGKRLGEAWGGKKIISNGSPVDILAVHYKGLGGALGQYVAVTNGGNDAICIAFMVVKWLEDNFAWIGDAGKECNADWYYSETIIRNSPTGQSFKPVCIWIDRDRSLGLRFQGFGMHIIDFDVREIGRQRQYTKYPETMCSRPRFHMYKDMKTEDDIYVFDPPLEYLPDGTDKDIRKVLVGGKLAGTLRKPWRKRDNYHIMPRAVPITPREQKLRSKFLRDVLIVSGWPAHKAVQLCKSQTSAGPDLVSLSDGLFCDMESKEVWPLCKNGTMTKHACFDVDTRRMKGGRIGARDRLSGRAIPAKAYATVRNWGS